MMKTYAALIIALASGLAANISVAGPYDSQSGYETTKPRGTTDEIRRIAGTQQGGGRIITDTAPQGSTDIARLQAGRQKTGKIDYSLYYTAPAGTTDAVRQAAGRRDS